MTVLKLHSEAYNFIDVIRYDNYSMIIKIAA